MSVLRSRSARRYGRSRPRPGYRRGRRLPLVALLLVTALVTGAGGWLLLRYEPQVVAAPACPPPAPPAPPPSPAPAAARAVTLNVYNATERQGLAASVAKELRKRGFTVKSVANDPLDRKVGGVGEVRHGPRGGPAAAAVGTHVDAARMAPDGRSNGSVDLVLGAGYRRLRTPQAAAAEAEAASRPSPPPAPRPAGC